MKTLITILLLTITFGIHAQELIIMPSYENSKESPMFIDKGTEALFQAPGYFVNVDRYEMYRKLHEFALSDSFDGHERKILDDYDMMLDDSETILSRLTQTTIKLEGAVDRLKTSEERIASLQRYNEILNDSNQNLQKRMQEIKPKKSWVPPAMIGVVAGLVGGILLAQ